MENPRLKNFEMTDNRGICQQCKRCIYNDGGNIYSNLYDKGYCAMYEYPDAAKPLGIIDNTQKCEFRKEEVKI